MNNNKYLTVSSLNKYISYKFDTDMHLQTVFLTGEITNYKKAGRHMYFSIKDEESEINAMIFYPATEHVPFEPKNGMIVRCQGRLQVYEKKGTYAIIIQKIEDDGLGALYQQYLTLLDKLGKEGMFDQSHKKSLPEYPRKVAIITSPTGEAINDIISTFKNRFSLAQLILFPALVQGSEAPRDLVRAVKQVYEVHHEAQIDVIIIGRGGGSFEDLSCFNDEVLARLLFKAPIPVISAVGHEGDFSICDYVASHRAPTPTGAATVLTKDRRDIIRQLEQILQRLKSSTIGAINRFFYQYSNLVNAYGLAQFHEILKYFTLKFEANNDLLKQLNPQKIYEIKSEQLSNLNQRIDSAIDNVFKYSVNNFKTLTNRDLSELLTKKYQCENDKVNLLRNRLYELTNSYFQKHVNRLTSLNEKNILLNPLSLMSKGYSIVYQDGQIKTSIKDIDQTLNIEITMCDGVAVAKIIKKIQKGENDEK